MGRIGAIVLAGLVLAAETCLAAPVINTVTGTVQEAGVLSIGGSGFGVKNQAPPVLYDTIDNMAAYQRFNLADGAQVPVRSDGNCADCPWETRIPASWGNAPKYFGKPDSTRVAGRPVYKVSKKGYFRGPNPFASLSESGEVYLSWWYWANHRLYGGTGGAVFNKLLRFTAGNSSTDWEEQIEIEAQNSYLTKNGCGSSGWDWMGGYAEPGAGTWNHVELYLRGGGDLNSGTGSVQVFFNGRQVSSSNSLYSCHGMLDHVYVWGADPNVLQYYPDNSTILFGEFYLDTTRARVVASPSADYRWSNPQNTLWEIQPAVAWNDSQVQIQFNQGNFAPGSTVYLYVITADGEISPGFPVMVGGEINAPSQPGQPQRQP